MQVFSFATGALALL